MRTILYSLAIFVCAASGLSAVAAMPANEAGDMVASNGLASFKVRLQPVAAISQRLVRIMSGKEEHVYLLRLQAVHALGPDLAADELNALYALLDRKDGEDAMSPEEFNTIKNDVVIALKKQTRPPADLAHNLAAMYLDAGHDEVWRDYCIQHLGDWYSSITNTNDQNLVRQVLWLAARTKGGTVPGTAMLALCSLAERPDFDRNGIAAQALAMVRDAATGDAGRITSLQVCVRLGNRQALPVARGLVNATGSVMLRVSAIACIGAFGDAGDKPLLEKQAASSDRRLRVAAEAALKRLGKTAAS